MDPSRAWPARMEQSGNVKILTFMGSRIEDELARMASDLDSEPDALGKCHLLLDFSNVEAISSTDLGTLIGLHNRLKNAGGRLTLFNLSAQVFEVFSITRLQTFLGICRATSPATNGKGAERHVWSGPSVGATKPGAPNIHVLLAYVADLELEVDRLRKQAQFLKEEVGGMLQCLRPSSPDVGAGEPVRGRAEMDQAVAQLTHVLRDLHEAPGYHPAHDQVITIALAPLLEQVFRWQQRLEGATAVSLRLELERDHVNWFPARLRHILENLISNSLKYRDPSKSESWVNVALRVAPDGYEFRVSDNGVGLPAGEPDRLFELFYRAAPARAAGLGVGLAVVKLLVEQSGGSLTITSGEGQGATFVAALPRYDIADYLT